jgi:hyperosmotically inducible periplasmic protein
MKSGRLAVFALAGLLGAGMSAPAFLYAQENTGAQRNVAGDQGAAGQEMNENAAPANGDASYSNHPMSQAYHSAKDELADAALTTKVKTALLKDKQTRSLKIHVNSDRGVVTLSGSVDSPQIAAQAQSIASNVEGVQSVNNELNSGMSSAR